MTDDAKLQTLVDSAPIEDYFACAATEFPVNGLAPNTEGVVFPVEHPEAVRSCDELESKLEGKFRTLLKQFEAVRADLESSKRPARRLKGVFPREATSNG